MESKFEYSAVAVEHEQKPRNLGRMTGCDGHAQIKGPCGDTMDFWLQVNSGRIHRVSFDTDGCGSSLACGSMTTELALGETVATACKIEQQDVLDALGGFPEESRHCAILSVDTLRAACQDHLNKSPPRVQHQPNKAESCGSCDSTS
jgi:nitrogen fixation protein NifU and related proteins